MGRHNIELFIFADCINLDASCIRCLESDQPTYAVVVGTAPDNIGDLIRKIATTSNFFPRRAGSISIYYPWLGVHVRLRYHDLVTTFRQCRLKLVKIPLHIDDHVLVGISR